MKTAIEYKIKQIGGKRYRSKKTGKLGKMRKKRFIVIQSDTSIRGYGRTKIVANKATRREAKSFIDAQE